MNHLSVPMFNDPMFWARLAFASAVSTVMIVAVIAHIARRTMMARAETSIIKKLILEKINNV